LCSKQFELAELDELMAPPEAESVTYGIALVFGRETQLWRISALQAIRVASLETSTQKHHRKGGQSQGRIGRLRENKQKHNVSFVGEELHAAFYDHDTNRPTVSGLIVAGAAQMHELVTDELADGLTQRAGRRLSVARHQCASSCSSTCRTTLLAFTSTVERAALAPLHELLAVRPELLEFGSCESILERCPTLPPCFSTRVCIAKHVAQLMAARRGGEQRGDHSRRRGSGRVQWRGGNQAHDEHDEAEDEDNTNEN
jgi:hypothetical protein